MTGGNEGGVVPQPGSCNNAAPKDDPEGSIEGGALQAASPAPFLEPKTLIAMSPVFGGQVTPLRRAVVQNRREE